MQACKISCTDDKYIFDMFKDCFGKKGHVSGYKIPWP